MCLVLKLCGVNYMVWQLALDIFSIGKNAKNTTLLKKKKQTHTQNTTQCSSLE